MKGECSQSLLLRRIKKIFSAAKDIDAILLVNTENKDPNFSYLTGYTSGVYEGDLLFVLRDKAYLLTSALEYATALSQKRQGIVVVNAKSSAKEFKKWATELFKGKRIGINGGFLPYSAYNSIMKYKPKALVDVSSALGEARQIKDESEISAIRKAVSITKFAMLEIQKSFDEGMTEQELAAKFDYLLSSLGSQEDAFKTIVCFGRNSAYPHHMPDSTKLKPGDFILIDAGAKVDNYCADMTRTFIFEKERAKDYEKMIDMYNTVKQAQLKAIRAIRPGKTGASIHKVASDYINRARGGIYKGKFVHSLGHAVGLEVHDGPGFSPGAKQALRKGMVITAEPGIYIEGFGGVRIEDDVLVTENGAIVL